MWWSGLEDSVKKKKGGSNWRAITVVALDLENLPEHAMDYC